MTQAVPAVFAKYPGILIKNAIPLPLPYTVFPKIRTATDTVYRKFQNFVPLYRTAKIFNTATVTATAKAVYRAAVFGNTVPLPTPGLKYKSKDLKAWLSCYLVNKYFHRLYEGFQSLFKF